MTTVISFSLFLHLRHDPRTQPRRRAVRPFGLREFWRRDPAFYSDLFDADRDGFYERIEAHTPTGVLISRDRDGDGRYDEYERRETSGVTETWTDTTGAGFFDAATIVDRDGKVLQQLQWVPGRGYEVTSR